MITSAVVTATPTVGRSIHSHSNSQKGTGRRWHLETLLIWSWSSFAGGNPCVAAASIERHDGFDIAAKIGRQAPGLAEEIVELHCEDGGDALNEIVARRVSSTAATPQTSLKTGQFGFGPNPARKVGF